MAKITRIETVGNALSLVDDAGKRYKTYPTGREIWVLTPPVGLDGSGGGTTDPTVPVVPPDPTPDPGDGSITIGPIPSSLSAKDTTGTTWTFTKLQLSRAADVIRYAAAIAGVNRDSIRIALITVIRESHFIIYSNVGKYPETAGYPHDADGSDGNSVGMYQQQPNFGWGTPAQCMDTQYATRAFIGGPSGPNNGSPRGLFDVDGWQTKTPGQAAQAVQGSAFPDRYDQVVPVANALMDALIVSGGETGSAWQWPFKYSVYVFQTGPNAALAQYGMRANPGQISHGTYRLHAGLDFGAGGIAGMDIPCASAGVVKSVGPLDARGNNVSVTHPGGFQTDYFHMRDAPSVAVGQSVTKGQKLGVVGATGNVTGPHLHWQTRVNGETVNPRDFMKARGVPES